MFYLPWISDLDPLVLDGDDDGGRVCNAGPHREHAPDEAAKPCSSR
jgi:hypothetical protein